MSSTDLESKSDSDSETQEKNLTCNICPSKPSFSNYGNRNKHISEVHNGVYYECDRCGMVYSQKIGVQRHKKNKHRLIRFYCNKCDK